MGFGRDVVLDVVPVRDDQVSGPTSARIQSVFDEYSWKHLYSKLMMTTFLFRRDWNKINFNPEKFNRTIEWSQNLDSCGDFLSVSSSL